MMTTSESESDAAQQAVARITPVIEAHRDAGERHRRLAEPIVIAMREAGLFRLWTPKEYGGSEVSLLTFMNTVEAISRIDGASGWTLANLSGGNMMGAFVPEAGAREVYANGPDVAMAGSGSPNGRAIPVSGGYQVSGRWPLSSGCQYGNWLGGVALVFDGDAPRLGPGGMPEFLAVTFRPKDCQILDTWNSVGLRGTGSTDFIATDVFVPEKWTFPFFTAQPRVSGLLYKAGILPLFSFAIVPVLLGIAQAGIEAFVELAKSKTPTMSQTGLATRPTIHAEVARAEALVQSARAYLYEVAREIMTAVASGSGVSEDLEAKRRLACVTVGLNCTRAVDSLFALAGATPVYSGHRLERCLRDVRTAGQHLFVSPVWWEKTGQYYFGQGLGMP